MPTRELVAVRRRLNWYAPILVSLAFGVTSGAFVYGGVTLAVWLASVG